MQSYGRYYPGSSCSRPRTGDPSTGSRRRTPNIGCRANCLDCRRARNSSLWGRPTDPSCFATDDIRWPQRRFEQRSRAASENPLATGSMSGSVCSTYRSVTAAPLRISVPSRISSVSPGTPTSRFTKFFVEILGELEDDHVAALGLAQARKPLVRERHLGAIDELVHEQEVADLQRVLHAAARNLERLDEERSDHAEQHHRDDEDLDPLAEEARARNARDSTREAHRGAARRDRSRRRTRLAVASAWAPPDPEPDSMIDMFRYSSPHCSDDTTDDSPICGNNVVGAGGLDRGNARASRVSPAYLGSYRSARAEARPRSRDSPLSSPSRTRRPPSRPRGGRSLSVLRRRRADVPRPRSSAR